MSSPREDRIITLRSLHGAACSAALRIAVAARVAAVLVVVAWSLPAAAQSCRSDSARALAGAYQRRPISAVDIVTAAPAPIQGAPEAIDNLHVRTREQTVRRNLLFAVGDAVDTLRVAESLRRLRRLRFLSDVGVVARSCAGEPGVALTVVTRDVWSTEPSVKVRSTGSAVVGLEERNVLGTGRDAKVYVRSDAAQLAFGVAYTDPWVAGTNVAASVARNAYRDGGDWTAAAGLRERSVFDPWHADVAMARSARETPAMVGDTVRRETAALLVGRRISHSLAGATSLLAGVEYDEARVVAGAGAAIIGPSTIRRQFTGVDVGLARRSASYGTATWYLPGGELLELPVAFEGEAVVSLGRDLAFGRPALHADGWLGRFWMPGDRLLLSADAWGSGYLIGRHWTAGSVRLALGADAPAARGRWTARFAAEQLSDPDPDVRALASVDPTLAALPQRARLAETALATSVERDVHLRRITSGYTLDVGGFGAASMRWDPAAGGERPSLGTIGAGLRLTPSRMGMARIGIDVGYPLLRSAGVPARPFAAFTVSPWLDANRMRDGRRQR